MRLAANVCDAMRLSRAQREWIGRTSNRGSRTANRELTDYGLQATGYRLQKTHPLLPMTLPVRRVSVAKAGSISGKWQPVEAA